MHSTTSSARSHDLTAADRELNAAAVALRRVVEALPETGTFAEKERSALDATNEVCRRYIEAVLQSIADSQPDEVRVEGRHYRRHERGMVAYHSLCGDVSIDRCSCRLVGVHNGSTINPLELAAGIIEGATPSFQAAHRRLPSALNPGSDRVASILSQYSASAADVGRSRGPVLSSRRASTSRYTGTCFVSSWSLTLNRSASSDRSISFNGR